MCAVRPTGAAALIHRAAEHPDLLEPLHRHVRPLLSGCPATVAHR
ncbi:hypothetical protein [Umezawaea beigongshangensis]|nr:hypothetical protein [Umezawaea beigongshangensis]